MPRKRKLDGLTRDQRWQRKFPEKVSAKGHRQALRRKGLTPEDYGAMLAQQSNRCAICANTQAGRRLAVDHCHTTGVVRGLLCSACNIGLGCFKDSIELLNSAVSYITRCGVRRAQSGP